MYGKKKIKIDLIKKIVGKHSSCKWHACLINDFMLISSKLTYEDLVSNDCLEGFNVINLELFKDCDYPNIAKLILDSYYLNKYILIVSEYGQKDAVSMALAVCNYFSLTDYHKEMLLIKLNKSIYNKTINALNTYDEFKIMNSDLYFNVVNYIQNKEYICVSDLVKQFNIGVVKAEKILTILNENRYVNFSIKYKDKYEVIK